MSQRLHPENLSRRRNRRQDKRERLLRKLTAMRAAKARKHAAAVAAGWRPEPKRGPNWHRFEFGVRDKLTGETHFVELKSVRQAAKALGLILKFY